MPKIAAQQLSVQAPDKTWYHAKVEVTVTGNGTFRLVVPKELEEIVRAGIEKQEFDSALGLVRVFESLRLETKKLASGMAFLRACATNYLTCETIISRVILYDRSLELSFYVSTDGTICADGSDRAGGDWFKGDNRNSFDESPFYRVGIYAAVYDKTIYRRPSGDTVIYKFVHGDHEAPEALLLNSFTGMRINTERRRDAAGEMDYTPMAALFFHRMLLGLCRLAKDIDDFFKTPEAMVKMINDGHLMLDYKPMAPNV